MRQFAPLRAVALRELFLHPPQDVRPNADPALLAASLGATLYCPGNRPRLASDLARMTAAGATSLVVCLEDSVRDAEVAAAQDNTIRSLRAFAAATPAAVRPLLFVRAREPRQLPAISAALGRHRGVLTGFVAPKVDASALTQWLSVLRILRRTGGPGRLMPVLESAVLAHPETRLAELLRLRAVLEADRGSVLAVRLGGTDLAASYGLRRPRELTVWELRPVADALSDIIGVLGRSDGTGFPISGVVWEYFSPGPSPGSAPPGGWKRAQDRFTQPGGAPDTFAREIAVDLAHGLTGKTVIHPSHIAIVNAAHTVDHEEFADARDVLSVPDGGAAASAFGNKMNEARPHRSWAERVLRRAEVFGVRRPGLSTAELAGAVQEAASRLPRGETAAVGTVR